MYRNALLRRARRGLAEAFIAAAPRPCTDGGTRDGCNVDGCKCEGCSILLTSASASIFTAASRSRPLVHVSFVEPSRREHPKNSARASEVSPQTLMHVANPTLTVKGEVRQQGGGGVG